MANIGSRSYLSTHMLWGGGEFARLAKSIEDNSNGVPEFNIRQRAYTIGSVMSAVGFAEAAINEIFQDIEDNHLSYIGSLSENTRKVMSAYWRESHGRGSILEKYQTGLGLAGCEPLSPSAEPFQSFALLINLRNMLVHFHPETVWATETQNIEKKLSGKFDKNPLIADQNPYFPDKCLGAACAQWAVSAARAFVDEFFKRINIKPNYQHSGWDEQGKTRAQP